MMTSGTKQILHTFIVKSESDKSYTYLIHENDADTLDVYLYSMQGSRVSYKSEVTSDILATIALAQQESSTWARNLLFGQKAGVLWCIETNQSSAKVTWKKNLANQMKFTLGSMTMVEYSSAPSDMLSICSAALQKETYRANSVQEKCASLEKENDKLRQLTEDAVQARQLLEDDLIAKFARLLNEKKSKIRALHELLAERRAEDLHGAVGTDVGAPDAALADRPASGDADAPDSDAYDQETDVDSGGEEPAPPGPSDRPPPDDSLDLDLECDALDESLPSRPKRPAPKRTPPPDKRRLADSDDLLDIV